ncbi:uncharacterized protein F4822DRAFT_136043 [Hypoxylon trugodes]|uniref:uncharacterized protein n=1 Tax=Hypoxylon trugodes TaxID=326681 RepID=UPI00219C5EDB|nr:uncharacterized protein F4822DRAFT_136043 [Hypoxylon trugodes]KAI1392634.1 hypothetical protein F4822DRAFT_136043 [Hypoxylon trugodes]
MKIMASELNSSFKITDAASRRGHGPGLLLLIDGDLDLRKHDKTLDPPPSLKWAEEGFAVAEVKVFNSQIDRLCDVLTTTLIHLSASPSCDQIQKIGIIVYMATVTPAILSQIEACKQICAIVFYGALPGDIGATTPPSLSHVPGTEEKGAPESPNAKRYFYPSAEPFFAIPAHDHYHASHASVAHTRTLTFLKPLLDGPYFDLEAIWDEHTYWEFEARSVEETMATMVEEPYVNHVPTLTGGVGRKALTKFYRDHFIFSNPPDTKLELISRTVGIDRVVDEFLFKATHDRMIDWLAPGVPATGKHISVPFTSVVNIRGDRLYHEHINWDQATLLKQLGLLPDYLPFPYPVAGEESAAPDTRFEYRLPVAGVESAQKLDNQSSVGSNAMLQYGYRKAP